MTVELRDVAEGLWLWRQPVLPYLDATIREFQKAELVVAPSIKTEGKTYQTAQRVGMGH